MTFMAKKSAHLGLAVLAVSVTGYGTTKALVQTRMDATENVRLGKQLKAARQLIERYREELAAVDQANASR